MKITQITIEATADDLKASRTLTEVYNGMLKQLFQNVSDACDAKSDDREDVELGEVES